MGEGERVIVVGGAGFLGSHLADALSDAGYGVSLFDIRESRWLRSNQEMILGNIQDLEGLVKAFKGAK